MQSVRGNLTVAFEEGFAGQVLQVAGLLTVYDTALAFSCMSSTKVVCKAWPLPAHTLPWRLYRFSCRLSGSGRGCEMTIPEDDWSLAQLRGEGCPVGMAGGHCKLRTAMQVVQRAALKTGRRMGVAEQHRCQRSDRSVTIQGLLNACLLSVELKRASLELRNSDPGLWVVSRRALPLLICPSTPLAGQSPGLGALRCCGCDRSAGIN
jgi:hypothetical protein